MIIVLGITASLSLVSAFYGQVLEYCIYMRYCVTFIVIYVIIHIAMFWITRMSVIKKYEQALF